MSLLATIEGIVAVAVFTATGIAALLLTVTLLVSAVADEDNIGTAIETEPYGGGVAATAELDVIPIFALNVVVTL